MLLTPYNDPDATAITRILSQRERDLIDHVDRLKHFLATAPSRWHGQQAPENPQPNHHPALNRFLLPSGEYVSCILWQGLYHITGTDIVRALVFRFEAFGRPVRNLKKFEEGVFSDLRNLKPGQDASLEEPKSPFLDLLFKYQCIRTQKKQKVFYWFSVPHDRLFLDALERDLKRERAGLEATTVVVGEPAASFWYDPKRSLHEQFSQVPGHIDANSSLNDPTTATQGSGADPSTNSASADIKPLAHAATDDCPVLIGRKRSLDEADGLVSPPSEPAVPMSHPVLSSFSLLGGSANYKRRRGKIARMHGSIGHISSGLEQTVLGDLPSIGDLVPVDMHTPVTESVHEQDLLDYDAPDPQMSLARAVPSAALSYSLEDSSSLQADAMSRAARDMAYGIPAAPGGKAFTCPLFSCGRLFKRMEHLKRHLRTHTMERPYECQLCHKRFSRSDNLNQHLRTHSRSSGGSAADLNIPAPPSEEQAYPELMLSVEGPASLHHDSPASSPEAQWLGPPIVTQAMYTGSLLSADSNLSTPSPTTTGPPVTPSPLQHFRSAPGSPGRPLSASGVYEHRAASEPFRHSWPGPDAMPEYAAGPPKQEYVQVPMKQEYVQAYTFGSAGSPMSSIGSSHSPMSSFGSVAPASPPEFDPYGQYSEQFAYVHQPQPQACFPIHMPLAVAAPDLAFTFA